MHVKSFIREAIDLPEKDLEEFAEWAWGPHFRDIASEMFMAVWDDSHNNELVFQPVGNTSENLKIMVELWKKKYRHGVGCEDTRSLYQ